MLWGRIRDYEFIKTLQEFASTGLCSKVAERISNGSWCKEYKGFRHLKKYFECRDKYRFVRNHQLGTLEFRFFPTCHTVRNVSDFLNFFFETLQKQPKGKTKEVKLNSNDEIELKSDYIFQPSNVLVSQSYKLEGNKEFNEYHYLDEAKSKELKLKLPRGKNEFDDEVENEASLWESPIRRSRIYEEMERRIGNRR